MKSVQLCKLNLFFGPHLFLFFTNYIYEHMVFVRKIDLYFGHIPLNKKKKTESKTLQEEEQTQNPF